jgi:hypothetical protein
MPEAVAIVYSPIEAERFKAFRVKDTRTMEIQKCSKSGFHEHKDAKGQPAWEVCRHIEYINGRSNGIDIQTLDLSKS